MNNTQDIDTAALVEAKARIIANMAAYVAATQAADAAYTAASKARDAAYTAAAAAYHRASSGF
jgi:hypothetical protein